MCFHKPCGSYRKSIRRDEIEGAFEDVLNSVTPSETKLSIAARMFATIWDSRLARAKEQAALYDAKIKDLDKQSSKLLDRLCEADSKTVISAYEARISKLEQQKLLLAEKAASNGQPRAPFEQMFELAMQFPANLCKIWQSGRFDLQRLALKLTFSERIAYHRNTGFRTPELSFPFKMLGDDFSRDCNMAVSVGFEPTLRD